MLTFLKAQAASILATFIDFLVTLILVEVFHCWYVFGNMTGTVAGGITHFLLGRVWVFDARDKKKSMQAAKYVLVWMGYILLHSSLVFLITHFIKTNYIVSKVCVSVLLGIGYNYQLHKKFVFK